MTPLNAIHFEIQTFENAGFSPASRPVSILYEIQLRLLMITRHFHAVWR